MQTKTNGHILYHMTQSPYPPTIVHHTKRWALDQEKLTYQPGAKKDTEPIRLGKETWEMIFSHPASVQSCEQGGR